MILCTELFEQNSQKVYCLIISGSDIDPVTCFEFYISKLNPNRRDLWQEPKEKMTGLEPFWFDNVPVVRDTLNDAIKTLSEAAKLSQTYTNHCIRATWCLAVLIIAFCYLVNKRDNFYWAMGN